MERQQFEVRALQTQSKAAAVGSIHCALPACPIHPGSQVRRYRSHGSNGPGVYPQCVPMDGSQPHLLSWSDGAPRASVAPSEVAVLSPSELEVLADAANGFTVTETARRRLKGRETVKTQRHAILMKLGARNIAQAVAMMTSDGLIATMDTRVQSVRAI